MSGIVGATTSPYGRFFSLADVNGDGKAELIELWNAAGWLGMIVYGQQPDGSYGTLWGSGNMHQAWADAIFLIGDVDGDGKAEVVQLWNGAGQVWMTVYGQHVDGSYAAKWGPQNMQRPFEYPEFLLGDVNADHKAEIIQVSSSSGITVYGLNTDGAYSAQWDSPLNGWAGAVVADIDGDGNSEVIQLTRNPPEGHIGMLVLRHETAGTYQQTWASSDLHQGFPNSSILAGDVNGDGKAEVVQLWNSSGQLGMIVYSQQPDGSIAFTWASGDLHQGWGVPALAFQAGTPASVTTTSAALSATFEPNGIETGIALWISGPDGIWKFLANLFSESVASVTLTTVASGLTPNTAYSVRTAAGRTGELAVWGDVVMFHTAQAGGSQPSPSADLTFVTTWIEGGEFPSAGQPFQVDFTYTNIGSATTPSFVVSATLDGDPATTKTLDVGACAPRVVAGFYAPVNGLPAGDHYIDAVLDIENQVRELSKVNNSIRNAFLVTDDGLTASGPPTLQLAVGIPSTEQHPIFKALMI